MGASFLVVSRCALLVAVCGLSSCLPPPDLCALFLTCDDTVEPAPVGGDGACGLVARCAGDTVVAPSSTQCEGDSAQILTDPCAPDAEVLCCLADPCCPAGSVAAGLDEPGAVEVGCDEGIALCVATEACLCDDGDRAVDRESCDAEAPCYEPTCLDGSPITCRA